MTDREIMDQALDALEKINKLSIGENAICLPAEIDTAMDALRERLAQPEQCQYPDCKCATENPCLKKLAQQTDHIVDANKMVLTDARITKIIDKMPNKMKGFMVDWDLYEFTRAIEGAHGIKGKA